MKKAIKLLVLAGALLSVGAMAQSSKFNFAYPDYFYIFTNLNSETFNFFATSPGSKPGTASTTYGIATHDNLTACLDDLLASAPNVTASTSEGTDQITGSCDFVATDTSTGSPSVDWGSTGENAEGAIIIVTNKSSWAAAAKITTEFSQVNGYVNLQLRTDSNTFTTLSTSAVNVGSLNGSLSNAYYTNYKNVYAVPLQYKLVLTNPIAIPVIDSSSSDTAEVTYEAGTP